MKSYCCCIRIATMQRRSIKIMLKYNQIGFISFGQNSLLFVLSLFLVNFVNDMPVKCPGPALPELITIRVTKGNCIRIELQCYDIFLLLIFPWFWVMVDAICCPIKQPCDRKILCKRHTYFRETIRNAIDHLPRIPVHYARLHLDVTSCYWQHCSA